MLVRCAEDSDASLAAAVVRQSITDLCAADYRGDPEVLARWLANKTSENFRRWIGSADRMVCVTVREDGRLTAVGMVAWARRDLAELRGAGGTFSRGEQGAGGAYGGPSAGSRRGQRRASQYARRAPLLPVPWLCGGRPAPGTGSGAR